MDHELVIYYLRMTRFFCQTNRKNIETLSQVLSQYGSLSCQMVNVEKSSIILGQGFSKERKLKLET